MADIQNMADGVKDLHLDEVTGERVSKTELKKRMKQREKETKKAEKQTTAPPQPKRKAASQEEEEGQLNANVSRDHCTLLSLRDALK